MSQTRPAAARYSVSLLLSSWMYQALGKNALDTRECRASRIGNVAPIVGSWPAHPVIEWPRLHPACLSNNDPSDHPCRFVRSAVVVIASENSQRDVEGCAGLHEETRVPRRRTIGNPQCVMIVLRMIGGRRVHVLACKPAHRRTRRHIEPDRIEPDPGTERVAA